MQKRRPTFARMRMRYNLLLLSIFCFVITNVQAQTYTYNKKFDNPDNVRNLNLSVFGGLNFGLADGVVGFQANYFNQVFSLQGRLELGLSGRLNFLESPDSFAARNVKTQYISEIIGAIHLMDKVKSGTYKYVLSSSTSYSGSYSTTTTKFLPVPTYYRRIVGLRGGLMNLRRVVSQYGGAGGKDSYENYYNLSNTNLFGGLMMKKVKFFKVGVEGFRRAKGIQQVREFFIDVMYTPSIMQTAGRVFGPDKETYTKRPFGFRMGWQWLSCRPVGGNFRLEFGLLPGYVIPNSDLYTSMTYGIDISSRVAKKRPDIYQK